MNLTAEEMSSILDENKDPKKTTGAKTLSKCAMIFVSMWIILMTALKSLKIIDIDIEDVIFAGIAVVAVWSPTYVSVWLDKLKEIKFGK